MAPYRFVVESSWANFNRISWGLEPLIEMLGELKRRHLEALHHNQRFPPSPMVGATKHHVEEVEREKGRIASKVGGERGR
jgi:hypothetical protein